MLSMAPGAIADRLQGIRERIVAAAGRAGRDPESVTLVGVSKTVPPDRVLEAVEKTDRRRPRERRESARRFATA